MSTSSLLNIAVSECYANILGEYSCIVVPIRVHEAHCCEVDKRTTSIVRVFHRANSWHKSRCEEMPCSHVSKIILEEYTKWDDSAG